MIYFYQRWDYFAFHKFIRTVSNTQVLQVLGTAVICEPSGLIYNLCEALVLNKVT